MRAVLLLVALALAASCSDAPATNPDGGTLAVCVSDAECGPGRICDGAVCRAGSRPSAASALDLSPDSVDFGAPQAGETVVRTVSASTRVDSLQIEKIAFERQGSGPDEIRVSFGPSLPHLLRRGAEPLVVTLTYRPIDGAADAGALVFTLEGGSSRTVHVASRVEGEPVLAIVEDLAQARAQLAAGALVEATSIDFGVVTGEATKRVYVVNAGNGNVPLQVASVKVDPSTDFALATTPAVLPAALPVLSAQGAGDQALALDVRFLAANACARTADLVVTRAGANPRVVPIRATRTPGAGEDPDADGLASACDACPNDPLNDADDDRACADVDNCPALANQDQADADGDGLGDACDSCSKGGTTDPDSDAICGSADNCPTNANPTQADADGDGQGDACDACTRGGATDADADGACAPADNCPTAANADQADTDRDGRGDACDNCPAIANADQADADSDGTGNACDACTNGGATDPDRDGVCTPADNCPAIANTTQVDGDTDGLGDACDDCTTGGATDVDRDGVCTPADNCPAIANATQVDADRDGQGDACDACTNGGATDSDSDGLCGTADNCAAIANPTQADGDADGLGDACDACPGNPRNDADGDGQCDVVQPPNITTRGAFSWTRLQIGGLSNPTKVEFHPDGAYFVVLDAYDTVHVIDWATKTDRRFNLKPSSGNIYWQDIAFDKAGGFAILVGQQLVSNAVTGVLFRLDDAAARSTSSTQAQLFTQWTQATRAGDAFAAIEYPWGAGNPVLLYRNTQNNIATLRDFDPALGKFGSFVSATNSSAGCVDLAWVDNEFGQPAILVTCGINGVDLRLWTKIGGVEEWRGCSRTTTNNCNLGNLGRASAHRFDHGALVTGWSADAVHRFVQGRMVSPSTFDWTNKRIGGVKYQQLGQRALIFGSAIGTPVAGTVFEYRYGANAFADLTDVSIGGFTGPPWNGASGWGLNDAAFRPGCDGGVLVGGFSNYAGATGFVAQFSIDNGAACP